MNVERKYGWRPSLPHASTLMYANHSEMAAAPALPPLMDLQPYFSPVEDQGQHGTCVGNGTAGVLEYEELDDLKKNQPVGPNSPELFGPSFSDISRLFIYANARIHDGTPLSQDAGTSIYSAIWSIQKYGFCRENIWPYADELVTVKPNLKSYEEAAKHKALLPYKINNANLDEIRQCLANKHPIVYGQSVYSSMESSAVAQSGIIPYPKRGDRFMGGHCMVIVGYDDAQKKLKLRNSWGVKWGLGGYAWIDYAYLTNLNLASDFWTLRKPSVA